MSTEQPWTVGRLLEWTAGFLRQKGAESARLDAQVLLAHALGCRRIDLYTRYEETATDEVRQRFREMIRKRLEGCPVAYLVGRKEFYSLELDVDPRVLIPRPDTETLVVECLTLAKPQVAPTVLDVGTGSGAIAIAVARQHPGAVVTATDVSLDALAVASRNAEKHGVSDRVRFLQGDLFTPLPAGERFDFILSNPPYIAASEWDTLPIGVRDFEPRLALDGGPDGYAVFDRLVEAAGGRLKPGGYLIVEIGSPQEGPARARLESRRGFELGKTVHDSSGHPRVLRARWRP